MNPCLYAIGVGPGDPELLTLKAVRLLREVDVIVAPTGSDDAPSLAQAIIADQVDADRQQLLTRTFPMRRDAEALAGTWHAIAAEIAVLLQSGRSVAFVTLGDPTLYSTFGYLWEQFQQHWPELPIEFVPGVTSFSAAAATVGRPLVQGTGRLAVAGADIGAGELKRLCAEFETVVLMKVARHFEAVRTTLIELGLADRAVFARRIGQVGETVRHDLATVTEADLDYFSLILVCR